MFDLIGIGERAGSGLPNIYAVWSRQGWSCPRLQEQFSPDRTVLTLSFEEFSDRGSTGTTAASGDKKTAIKDGDKKTAINRQRRELVVEYLKKSGTCKTADISQLLDLKPSRAREYLALLVREGLLESAGANRNRTYRLGSNNR